MRKLITVLTTLLLTASIFAQAPQKMSYQAVIRNNSGTLVTSAQIGIEINIRQGSPTGTVVYTETQTPTTNANGLVSIEIGGGAGFSNINWASDNYYIETKTAVVAPLTTYTITGVSQLLSVPYALNAKTAESITGTITETDPVYTNSQAANITSTDITNLGNLSGINTGDQDISGIAINAAAIALNTAKLGQISGTAPGQMQYWNGTSWVLIAASANEGATLTIVGGVPTWIPPTVINPSTGKVWMDRNLGAARVATSSTDAAAYGDLYQWGRGNDGHQIRTSGTTTTLSSTDVPGHANFILAPASPYDWRSPQNSNLWQGVNGVNNPCPAGYRIPTDAELDAERANWSSNDFAGAYASPLKLTAAGRRLGDNGSLNSVGSLGLYWSSTLSGIYGRSLLIQSDNAYMNLNPGTYGVSVRCIKD